MPLAALGLIASIVVHVATLLTSWTPPDALVVVLVAGIFVLAVPTIVFAQPFLLDVGSLWRVAWRHDHRFLDRWRLVTRGSSRWMERCMIGLFVYYIVLFVTVVVMTSRGGVAPQFEERMKYAGLMAFYSGFLQILSSALTVARRETERRCTVGHLELPGTSGKYCEICRRPVLEQPAR